MPKTLEQLNKQIAQLQKQADAVRQKEIAGVIGRIKEAIAHYGLTAEDLGFGRSPARRGQGRAAKATKATKAARAGRGARKSASRGAGRKKTGTVKYRDEQGNTWSGQGRRPKWFVDALAAGKTPEALEA